MIEVDGKGTFEDRLNIVLEELSLGIQWKRSCLILVVYRSENIKSIIQSILEKSLEESGQAVIHFAVDKLHYDIPMELQNHPRHKQAVFYVSGLRWGGGRGYSNAFRALNMHREYLVEGNIRAIFWLTMSDAKQLTRFSPDFWAFRHKVVEFLELPSVTKNIPLESPKFMIHNLYTNNTYDFQKRINSAEMSYALGCIDEAILNFRKALRKYPDEIAISLRIAEIYLHMGRLQIAGRILKKADKGKIERIAILRELDRLIQAANSTQNVSGGFLEQPT